MLLPLVLLGRGCVGLDVAGLSMFSSRVFSIEYYFMTLSLNGYSMSSRNLGLDSFVPGGEKPPFGLHIVGGFADMTVSGYLRHRVTATSS